MAGVPIDAAAVELYRSLILERLRAASCSACRRSLADAAIEWVNGGTTHDEHHLSDPSLARALAATEHLIVRCAFCGSDGEIGSPTPSFTPAPAPPPGPDLEPQAIALYRRLIQERLQSSACSACGHSLVGGQVLGASGGTHLDAYDLSDQGIARLLAATQDLSVRCSACGDTSKV